MSNLTTDVPTLTETNYQQFLEKNLTEIFVFETPDYEYQYYLPTHFVITGSCKVSTKYKLQA
jgi:hypothetical protein